MQKSPMVRGYHLDGKSRAVDDCFFVGVCGGSASGKSHLSRKISDFYRGSATIISQDDYYHDNSHLTEYEREIKNYDHPDAIDLGLLYKNLSGLKSGVSVEAPRYSFESHGRMSTGQTFFPNKIIIVEGLFVFQHPELRQLLDLKVFLTVDHDIRLIRRIRRDVEERGRSLKSVLDQYVATTKPMHDEFIEPASQYADQLISCLDSKDMDSAVTTISQRISDLTTEVN